MSSGTTAARAAPADLTVPTSHVYRGTRLRVGALLSTGGALTLAVSMIALEWYGVVGHRRTSPQSGVETATGAWHELTVVRWLLLATVLAPVVSLVLHVSQRDHGSKSDISRWIAGLGSVAAVALIYRVLLDPPSPGDVVDIKLGAYLGLLSAIAVGLGGVELVRERQARRRELARRTRSRSGRQGGGKARRAANQ